MIVVTSQFHNTIMQDAYFGYVRVSTLKQGAGVSLTEQKDAISRYAAAKGLAIAEWFEEKETAAKQGRPLFLTMMRKLRNGQAKGVIMHKIDRSARNLKDWSDLGALIDRGIDVRFAHESLDMTLRGGRLSADIQAVIAADYIRNLRDEAMKGLYGRLKQGIYPFRAPLGYLDTGSGNAKAKDPAKAPLVRKAFELYATQRYSLRELVEKMDRLGLRNYNGKRLHRSNMASLLGNPFYAGILRTKNQYFKGIHEPLVSQSLYKAVQDALHGKVRKKVRKHDFLLRRLIRCKHCRRLMYGEIQKSHGYYRCHTEGCPTKCVREASVSSGMRAHLAALQILPDEADILGRMLGEMERDGRQAIEEGLKAVRLQVDSLRQRMEQLTDAYLDGVLSKEDLQERKQRMLLDLAGKEAAEAELRDEKGRVFARIAKFLELAKSLVGAYESAIFENRRRLVETVFSNLEVDGKKVTFTMHLPFNRLLFREDVPFGALNRDTSRLHGRVFDAAEEGVIAQRKPMSREQLKQLLKYLVAHPELLPEHQNEGGIESPAALSPSRQPPRRCQGENPLLGSSARDI